VARRLEVTNAGLEEAFLALTQIISRCEGGKLTWPPLFSCCLSRAAAFAVAHDCALRKEAKYELINKTRIPVYALSTIAIPLMFYVLFGSCWATPATGGQRNLHAGDDGCFGTMAVALFGFGVSLAMERGQGWLQVKRASPSGERLLSGQTLRRSGVQHVIMLLLLSVGIAFGGYVCRSQPRGAGRILVAGSIPFSAMGLASDISPSQTPASRGHLIYLPMSFCSGLWIPLSVLPHGLRRWPPFCRLSPQPVGAECSRMHRIRHRRGTRRGVTGVHPAVPGLALGLSSRRRKAVRMRKAALRLSLMDCNGS